MVEKTTEKVIQMKINAEDLLRDYKISNIDTFSLYLKSIWTDLSKRSEKESKGVNKLTFSKVTSL